MSSVPVNADNLARAESDRMFAAIQAQAGGVNQWYHYRAPTPVDKQTVPSPISRPCLTDSGPLAAGSH